MKTTFDHLQSAQRLVVLVEASADRRLAVLAERAG